ncbi:MAG: hypothetical protein J7518_12455 [Nocardioidaceae bacterium]|nr:hypothetical protein [Nocardioidaceae bacterium]
MTAFAYCRDCNELTTGVMDLAKGFLLGSETNHLGCTVTYLDPMSTPPPIATAIARLAVRPDLCTDTDAILLRLGLELHGYKETECPPVRSTARAAASTWPTSPADVRQSAASTRSQPASTPTLATSARPEWRQRDLFSAEWEAAS